MQFRCSKVSCKISYLRHLRWYLTGSTSTASSVEFQLFFCRLAWISRAGSLHSPSFCSKHLIKVDKVNQLKNIGKNWRPYFVVSHFVVRLVFCEEESKVIYSQADREIEGIPGDFSCLQLLSLGHSTYHHKGKRYANTAKFCKFSEWHFSQFISYIIHKNDSKRLFCGTATVWMYPCVL